LNAYRKGVVATQFLYISAVGVLLAASFLYMGVQIKNSAGMNGARSEGLLLAQRVASFLDGFDRDICYGAGCGASLELPKKLAGRGFADMDYNLTLSGNMVIVSTSRGNFTAYTVKGVDGLGVAIDDSSAYGKVLNVVG